MYIDPEIIVGKTQRHLAIEGEFIGVLHQAVTEPFNDLVARAAKAGFDLRIISGYRSFERQLLIWNAKATGGRPILDDQDQHVDISTLTELQTINAIMRFSAMPGSSRHHWGTDMDVYDARVIEDDQVQLTYSETVAGGPFYELHRWLDEELPKTEFYRPYERDTGGVSVEPWHLSYKPLAAKYATAMSADLLLKSYHGVEIELIDSIKTNIDVLFRQFIWVD